MDAKEYGRVYRAKHKAKLAEYNREYRAKHKDQLREKHREYQRAHATRINKRQRAAREADPTRFQTTTRRYRTNLKNEVLGMLGGKCECCNETEPEFLCVDHRFGGGSKHRRELRQMGQSNYKVYIQIRDGSADIRDFRALCYNCNFSARLGNGHCLHQRRKIV
jgi:hypothetical protein